MDLPVHEFPPSVAHGSQQTDVQGFGQPEPLILWQKFAYAIMQLADGDRFKIKRARAARHAHRPQQHSIAKAAVKSSQV